VSAEFRPPTLDDLPALGAFFAELRDRYGAHVPTEGKLRDDLTRTGENVGANYRIELAERRRETREQLLTCRRGGEPPGRAMKERNSELLFEAANRLAERRRGDAEMRRGTHEAAAFHA